MTEAARRPSRWRVFAPETAGAIYGTIAAMAVIAGTAASQAHAKTFYLTVATLFVFWLAHVYAHALAPHLRGAKRLLNASGTRVQSSAATLSPNCSTTHSLGPTRTSGRIRYHHRPCRGRYCWLRRVALPVIDWKSHIPHRRNAQE